MLTLSWSKCSWSGLQQQQQRQGRRKSATLQCSQPTNQPTNPTQPNPTQPNLWPSYCNGATAREILRSSPKAWNQIKLPRMQMSQFCGAHFCFHRQIFWWTFRGTILVQLFDLWRKMQKICWSIKYLSGPLGHKKYCIWAARSCSTFRHITHFSKLCSDTVSQYFLHCFELRGHGGMLLEDNSQCCATSRHWGHHEEAPPTPSSLQYGSQANLFPHIVSLNPPTFLMCKTFYVKWISNNYN